MPAYKKALDQPTLYRDRLAAVSRAVSDVLSVPSRTSWSIAYSDDVLILAVSRRYGGRAARREVWRWRPGRPRLVNNRARARRDDNGAALPLVRSDSLSSASIARCDGCSSSSSSGGGRGARDDAASVTGASRPKYSGVLGPFLPPSPPVHSPPLPCPYHFPHRYGKCRFI